MWSHGDSSGALELSRGTSGPLSLAHDKDGSGGGVFVRTVMLGEVLIKMRGKRKRKLGLGFLIEL